MPWKQVFHEGWFLFGMCNWFDIVTCHSLSLRMTSSSAGLWVWWVVVLALFVFGFRQLYSLGLNPSEWGVLTQG